ncbi:hypothetical protein BH09MYX1_BH09MYX1_39120 [soil metagenome]
MGYPLGVLALLRRHPSLLPSLAVVTYLVAVSATRDPAFGPRIFFGGAAAIVLAIFAGLVKERAFGTTLLALAVSIAVLIGHDPSPLLRVVALGVGGAAAIAARRAVALVPSLGGLAAREPTREWAGYVIVAVPWLIPVALTLARHPAANAVAIGAGPTAIVLFFGVLSKHRLDRRQELGTA